MKIKLEHVSKSFNEQVVLDKISHDLDFQSLAIFGPSGSGKSTLLRMIAGLLELDEGKISLDDQSVPSIESELIKYRQTIGFVFQNNGLFPHLTALQNITLPLVEIHGYTKEDAEKETMKYLHRFGLIDQAHQSIVTLSGGQQQRIQIIRAIIHKPRLVLLDEPTSALDPDISVDVLEMLKELIKEGIQIILVTHHLGFAKNVCDQVVFIDENTIIEAGSSKQCFENPKSKQLKHFLDRMREFE